jgi:hypothetical protein
MPKLIDGLSDEQRRNVLHIIENLRTLEGAALEFADKHTAHINQLERASSQEELYGIVQKIALDSTEADAILMEATKTLDTAELFAALDECIQEDAQLTKIWSALHFSTSIPDCILATKERLDRGDIYTRFSGTKRETARTFIEGIAALKPIAEIIVRQKEVFQTQLSDCSSIDEVCALEEKINAHNDVASKIKNAVALPGEEDVRAAVVNYINNNTHIRSTWLAFSLSDSLAEDILNAKMRVSTTISNRM